MSTLEYKLMIICFQIKFAIHTRRPLFVLRSMRTLWRALGSATSDEEMANALAAYAVALSSVEPRMRGVERSQTWWTWKARDAVEEARREADA